MNRVQIVTDSSACLSSEIVRELNITVVPAYIIFEKESFRDGVDLTAEQFYAKLTASKIIPTTSVPPPALFEETYRQLGERGHQILSVHLASKLSGMLNAAQTAAATLPDLEIRLVDSQSVSMGLGWLAILAARAAREGRTLDEIASLVEDAAARTRIIAVLDTLEYIRRSGRASFPQAFVGTLLDVKPILLVRDGIVAPIEKVRARHRAMARAIELAAEMAPFDELAILHTHAPALAEELRARMSHIHPVERMLTVEAGPLLGSHVGPGGFGFAGVIARRV